MHEAHEMFGVPTSKLVNVNTDTQMSPVSFTITGDFGGKVINIPVMVKVNDTWKTLTANIGEAASKIAVSTSYIWCTERLPIDSKYPAFIEWIQNPAIEWY